MERDRGRARGYMDMTDLDHSNLSILAMSCEGIMSFPYIRIPRLLRDPSANIGVGAWCELFQDQRIKCYYSRIRPYPCDAAA